MRPSGSVATRLALFTAVLTLSAGYLLLLWNSAATDIPQERSLAGPGPAASRVRMYLEVAGIDPVRDAVQIRLTMEPGVAGSDGSPALPDRDLTFLIAHDNGGERVEVHARQPAPTTTVELDLHGGNVADYPFDAYHADVWLRCTGALPAAARETLPVDLTIWERSLGFRVRTNIEGAGEQERLTFDIRRSRSFMVSAVSAYGAMLVLACGALTIGVLAAARVRRAEPTMVGALSAVVFALPALRNALPGTPPLGVTADVLVLFWAELAAVLALAMLIATWARTGPRP